MNLSEAKTEIIKGKKVRFDLSDGYGILEYRFGKVVLTINTEGGSSTFKGDFKKIQKTFGKFDDAEFEIVDET